MGNCILRLQHERLSGRLNRGGEIALLGKVQALVAQLR